MTTDVGARASRGRLIFEMAKRPDLQGMRAVAVLSVYADHLFGWPSGGFVGVDVFFVLSGFFITGLLLRERSQTGEVSFQDFYVRRVKRILPSALLVLVVTVIGAYVLLSAVRAKQTLLDALWAALFGANIRFETVGADYFQQDLPPSPIQHYWSLSIEEQFYFVWPLLLVTLFAVTRKWYRRGHIWTRQWGLFLPMAAIVAASFGWAMYLTDTNPNAAYFSSFTRVWELGVGALLAIAGPWLRRIPAGIRPVLAYLGLAGVVASLFLIGSESQFPAPWAALPVLSTAVVIASFHGAEVRAVPLLTNPVARWFGDTSYTLYLWHWPVIVLLQAVIPKDTTFYVVALVLSLCLTALVYTFYEQPIRHSNWLLGDEISSHARRRRRKRRGLALSHWALAGLVLIAVTVTSILYIEQVDSRAAVPTEANSAVVVNLAPPPPAANGLGDAPALSVVPGNNPCFGAPAIIDPACALRNPGVPLQPSLDEFYRDGVGTECWTEKDAPLNSCTLGDQSPDAIRIALVGDSHAYRYIYGITSYLVGEKWRLTTYIGQGCVWKKPAIDICKAMPDIETQLLTQKYDLVLTTSRRGTDDASEYLSAWQPVLDTGSRLAVIVDNPQASEESIACLTRVSFGEDRSGECATPQDQAVASDPQVLAAGRMAVPIYVIDLTPYYCTNGSCPAVIGDVIVYSDTSSHVTETYMKTLGPALVNGIRTALN